MLAFEAGRSAMTSAQLILVSVTSATVAVFAMLVVAIILRARGKDDSDDN